jgi:hypothetical protein
MNEPPLKRLRADEPILTTINPDPIDPNGLFHLNQLGVSWFISEPWPTL